MEDNKKAKLVFEFDREWVDIPHFDQVMGWAEVPEELKRIIK